MKQEDIIGEWVAEMSLKDGGTIWHKDTKDEYPAPITYGDLRMLMEMEYQVQKEKREIPT